MSLNYSASLSPYSDKGKCGLPESFESIEEVTLKCEKFSNLIHESRRIVCLTGAGLSTSCGIPDFRGPNGIWTLQQKGLPLPESKHSVTFDNAVPSYTHFALVELNKIGKLDFLISQNIDGLHMKSGFPMSRLAELHGNMFIEKCQLCSMKYITKNCAEKIGLKSTGRKCSRLKPRGSCRGELHDTILDWNDELPLEEMWKSELNCKQADLCICLGTTLQIMPVGGYPLLTKKNGGKIVIVNLQETRINESADLIINQKLDIVFKILFEKFLNVKIKAGLVGVKKELANDDKKYHLNVSDMRVDESYFSLPAVDFDLKSEIKEEVSSSLEPHLILLFSGKRKSGKSYIAEKLFKYLRENSGRYNVNEVILAAPLKEIYARENNLDYERLLDTSSYKELHRVEMIKWSDLIRLKDPFFFCKIAVDKARRDLRLLESYDTFNIWIVTDLRLKVELEYFQVNFPGLFKTVRILADESVRIDRNWVFTKGADDWTSECDLDSFKNWDFIIRNNVSVQELNEDFGSLTDYLVETRQIYLKSDLKKQ